MKYFILITMLFCLAACVDNIEDNEYYSKAYFGIITTSENDCGLILHVDSLREGVTKPMIPVNPPDSIYRGLSLDIQYEIIPDSFYCSIIGPIVGTDADRDKSFVYIELLKIKE